MTPAAETTRSLRVVDRRDVADNIVEISLAAVDGELPAWEPGAHIDLRLGADLVRQYSLMPPRPELPGTWRIGVLIEHGGRGGSKLIAQTLHVDSVVTTSGPRNHFPLAGDGALLLIAGGIGVTPLLAMAETARATGRDWRLAYLGRSTTTMAYLDELLSQFPDNVTAYVSPDASAYDVRARLAAEPESTDVYCCGPEGLLNAVEDTMVGLGRVERVHLERFHPRADAAASPNVEFTVVASSSGVEFTVPEDESVLMAADFEGIIVPGDCLEGTCGSCETRVLEGEVEHRDTVLSPAQRAAGESMMICVSRAKPGCTRLVLDL